MYVIFANFFFKIEKKILNLFIYKKMTSRENPYTEFLKKRGPELKLLHPGADYRTVLQPLLSAEYAKTKQESAKSPVAQKRAPSAYNIFMSTEIPRVKRDNPTLDHKTAFKLAAAGWTKLGSKKPVSSPRSSSPKKSVSSPRQETSYNVFVREQSAKFKERGTKFDGHDGIKEIARLWRLKTGKPEGVKSPKSSTPKTGERPKRGPSPYNFFMKDEIADIKKRDPSIDHKEAFILAAANWKKSKKNPANK